MKRVAVLFVALALGVGLIPARPAYAWPEPIEGFITAMQTGDRAAALAVLNDAAVVTLPAELVPPDSRLLPAGTRAANATLTLTGKVAIGAWLDEFTERDHGRLYIEGPARGNGTAISANARIVADSLREVFTNWPVGSVDLTLEGDTLTTVTLTLSPESLRALRRANPQAYGIPRSPTYRDPNRSRAL
jgi:hypothetical protein